jgi:hypothetical protein
VCASKLNYITCFFCSAIREMYECIGHFHNKDHATRQILRWCGFRPNSLPYTMYSMRDWPRPRRSSLWAEVTYETREYRNLPEFWAEMGKAIGNRLVSTLDTQDYGIWHCLYFACLHLLYDSRNLLYYTLFLFPSHLVWSGVVVIELWKLCLSRPITSWNDSQGVRNED